VLRLAVRVRREHAELVLAELLELAPSGVEEVALDATTVEYAVYGAPGELPALPDLEAAAGTALVLVATTEVADDWAERWREFHRPLVLGERLTVRPPWEPPGRTALDVVIDPGQAFGTGAHHTTRLCLELMLELPPSGGFADLGCGSGVLAIVAAKLGYEPVLAFDSDPASVVAARANARVNGVPLSVERVDLRIAALPAAETIAANLLRPLLLTIARRISEAPRRLIASGLLHDDLDQVVAAFERAGLHERSRRTSGEWAALLLERE
jgi:ribosomal protein L11 methyltransferase